MKNINYRESVISRLSKEIFSLLTPQGNSIICLDGAACAGKTRLAEELRQTLSIKGVDASVMPIDNFCRPHSQRYVSELPDDLQVYHSNFDYDLFEKLLQEAKASPYWSFQHKHLIAKTDKYEGDSLYQTQPGSLMIVEGIHTLKERFRKYYDLTIFIEVSPEIQLERAKIRDIDRGNTPHDILYKYTKRYRPSYDYYLKKHQPDIYADIVIDNSDALQPIILKGL